MQIVINIPETDKEIIDNGMRADTTSVNLYRRIIMAIQQGTILPKGHGSLIDADERRREIDEEYRWVVDLAPTVVKADKEE